VSNTGLVFQVADPQAAHRLDHQVIEFVGVGAAAIPGDAFAAVDGAALRVLFEEGFVTGLLDEAGDFIDGGVPGDVFPVVGAGAADLGLEQAAFVDDVLLERGAFGAEGAAVDGVVGIALDVDDLGGDVLGFVAEGVENDPAAYRALGTGAAGRGGAGDFEVAGLGVGGG